MGASVIGYEPIVDNMVIVVGQDFSHFFAVEESSPFPFGTSVMLKIFQRGEDGQQLGAWPAVMVEPGGALVQINADDLYEIPDASQFRVYVEYPDEQILCWYRGRIWRRT